MVTPVEIINQVIHVAVDQIQDSLFTIILSISTLAVATITGIGLWKTLRKTTESNKLFALEINAKFNPSFDFTNRLMTQIGEQGEMAYVCRLLNTGNVSVSNIMIYHREYPIPTQINDIIRGGKGTLFDRVESTLEPKRDHGLTIPFEGTPHRDIRFVIWLEFEYLQFKAEGIVWLDHFAAGTTGYSWFDNDFIKNKRKELKI